MNKSPSIAVVGGGYVGLVTAVGLAELGFDVVVHEVDPGRRATLLRGYLPIREPGLEELWRKCSQGNLRVFGSPGKERVEASIIFICVGTPSKADGSIDLSFVEEAARSIGASLRDRQDFPVVVVKSTVIPGTTEGMVLPILQDASGGKAGVDFGVAANPEFLREGSAVDDFFHPDRLVLGVLEPRTEAFLRNLYAGLPGRVLVTRPRTAEMIKYASNAFLAARISLANEIGNLCKALEIDAYRVMEGVGMDPRIGPRFLATGAGFGGSCLPKDVRALLAQARSLGREAPMLRSTLEVNEAQPLEMMRLLRARLGDPRGRRVAVLGLAFKAHTDDVRESRAIPILRELLSSGAKVAAYDPQASPLMAAAVPGVEYAPSAEAALKDAEACLVVADWPEFYALDAEFKGMKRRLVIDGRHIISAAGKDIEYEGLCW